MKRFILFFVVVTNCIINTQEQSPNQIEALGSSSNLGANVIEQTGDFSYGIPLLVVPGSNNFNFDLILNYNSNFSPNSEASWIGWGWNLNLGAITRIQNGLPDDYNEAKIEYYNKKPDYVAASVKFDPGKEIFTIRPLSADLTYHYSNIGGYYKTYGASLISPSLPYIGGMSMSWTFNQQGDLLFNDNYSGILGILNSIRLNNEKGRETIRKQSQILDIIDFGISLKMGSTTNYYTNRLKYSATPVLMPEYNSSLFSGRLNFRLDYVPKIGIDFGIEAQVFRVEYEESYERNGVGYMYSNNNNIEKNIVMDYNLDRSNPFNYRDRYLPIPVGTPDEFIVTGPGVGGSFRYFFDGQVNLKPYNQKNKTNQFSIGGGINLGSLLFGISINGKKSLNNYTEIIPLDNNTNSSNGYFRFNNDPGVYKKLSTLDYSSGNLDVNGTPISNIRFHTIGDIRNHIILNRKDLNFNKMLNLNNNSVINEKNINSLISEFEITNSSGIKYVYGLPVFSDDYEVISFGLPLEQRKNVLSNSHYPYSIYESRSDTKIGNKLKTPFSSTFLLTEMRNSNYYDVTNDGPTVDDMGDYIAFDYVRTSANRSTSKHDNKINLASYDWSKWRIPYSGYDYNINRVSKPNDDLITRTSGTKEIYYLNSIRTKTHIAFFVNNMSNVYQEKEFNINMNNEDIVIEGSGNIRKDSWEENASSKIKNIFGKKHLQYNNSRVLEKIVLFTLDTEKEKLKGNDKTVYVKKKLKTINLEQDYSLRKGIPNSSYKILNETEDNGKLTLKKIWTDYQDVKEAYISPFEFEYKYPTTSIAEYPPEYLSFENYQSTASGDLIENPDFSNFQTDRWGSYQLSNISGAANGDLDLGKNRAENLINSIDQIPNLRFDPAAWRLKKIKQPTDGEIHVQYEQKDYSNVQDRETYILANIKSTEVINDNRVYTLDLKETYGTNIPLPDLTKIVNKINFYFAPNEPNGLKRKIYGKFLFNMLSEDPLDAVPNLSTSYSEYVDGFVRLISCSLNVNNDIEITVNRDPFREMCIRDYKTYSHGLLPGSGDYKDYKNLDNIKSNVTLVKKIIKNIGDYNWAFNSDYCWTMNNDLSYLRIPLIKDKLAGGARVKRILYYDKFNKEIESDNSSLYGVEYIYKNEDGSSSGVASNEPSKGEEENSLIEILDYRFDQTLSDRSVNGKDRDQFYSPLGDNLLESAFITYSRVIQKSIDIFDSDYSITNSGFTVNEYFTTKDFPYDKKYSTNSETIKSFNFSNLDKVESKIPWIPNPFVLVDISSFNGKQDYYFIKNRFNGVLTKSSTYSGNLLDKSSWRLRSFKKNNYLMPGESVPLFTGFNYNSSLGSPLNFECGIPGLDIESYKEHKESFETKTIIGADSDLDVLFLFLPIGLPSAMFNLTHIQRQLVTKITTNKYTFPLILKSVETYNDGSYSKVENLAFDHKTGSPVITKSSDEFDGLVLKDNSHVGNYHNYSFPASYKYDDFNKLSITKELENENFHFFYKNGTLKKMGSNKNLKYSSEKYLQKGDIIKLKDLNDNSNFYLATVTNVTDKEVLISNLNPPNLEPDEYYLFDVKVVDSRIPNIPKITSDNITSYGSDDVTDYCGIKIPNDFTHVNQVFFDTYANEINDLKNELNTQISSHLGLNNFSNLDLDFSNTNLNHIDIINRTEPLNDTSKIQVTAIFDTTINKVYPLDSIEVSLIYNNKNEIKLFESFPSSHHLINTLNNALNNLWSLELNNILNSQIIFNNCQSNDSLNQFYSNFYLGELDSQRTDSIFKYTSIVNIMNDKYLVYNQDSLKHIYTSGKDILNYDKENTMFISYRDLDSNNNPGYNKVSYLSRYFSYFSNDTNNNKFEFKFLKYFKPNCSESDSLECFKQDCRDTSLLENNVIRDNWDNTFILLPGLENHQNLIYFPSNDSLFTYLSERTNFTDEFGYFGLDNSGFLTYNTIQSPEGYGSDTTYKITKIIDIDSNETVAHINTQTFIINPSLNSDVFTIDTNNNFQLAFSNNVILDEGLGTSTFINTSIFNIPYIVNFKADNVIKAVSQTFKYPDINPNNIPDKEIFSDKTYLYRKNRQYSNSESYASTGIIENFNTYYHRANDINNPNWFRVNSNTIIDTEGKIFESINLKNVKSSVLYDKLNRQKIISTNAGLNELYFNDFELPDWGTYYSTNNTISHTGYRSELIKSNYPSQSLINYFIINNISVTENVRKQGLILKFWAHISNANNCYTDENSAISIDYWFNSQPISTHGNVIPVSKSGEWYLYEVVFPKSIFLNYTDSDNISFQINNSIMSCHPIGYENIYLDDILVKPLNSFSECYIYDYNSNRISATLDNNHFANVIQYNEKGIPVRSIVETYQGFKTVSESQINTPYIERTPQETTSQMLINQGKSTNTNIRISASEIIDFKKNTPKEQQVDAKFNILDLKISQDSSNIKYLNFEKNSDLDTLESFDMPTEVDFNKIKKTVLPDTLEINQLKKYDTQNKKINEKIDSLNGEYKSKYELSKQIEEIEKNSKDKELGK